MANNVVKVGAYAPPVSAMRGMSVDGTYYDITELNIAGGLQMVVDAQRLIKQKPGSPEPMRMLFAADKILVGAMKALPPALHPVFGPMVQAASGPMMEAAKEAVRLRMRSQHELMKHPTQSIPLTLDSATAPGTFVAGSTATFVIQNPYIGSGGAMSNAQGIWAITGLESGALVNVPGLIITQATFAGHDYVEASLNGILSTTGTGASSTAGGPEGWDFCIFASDKRTRDHTVFSPWNIQGSSNIIGSIMRETGTVTLGLRNLNNTTFQGGAFHVHVKASLCGSPFTAENVHKMFVPFNQQHAAATRMAAAMPSHFAGLYNSLQQQNMQLQGLQEEGLYDMTY